MAPSEQLDYQIKTIRGLIANSVGGPNGQRDAL
jgi:hypothetical protein